jgi:hypothetical protein
MSKTSFRRKKGKLAIFLAPLLGAVFLVGWVLCYIGEPKNKHQQKPTPKKHRNQEIEFMVIPKEEQIATC